jgi:hypothetical protein|eukprot:COSAG01_NODE_1743_length_9354_cov_76.987574_11_plen_54_part_00
MHGGCTQIGDDVGMKWIGRAGGGAGGVFTSSHASGAFPPGCPSKLGDVAVSFQ